MIYDGLRRLIKQITQITVCLALLSGCGYTTRSLISNEFKTIYITPFVNKIDVTVQSDVANKYRINKPLLETDITRAVSNKYLFDGNLKPVKEENADLVLKGELVEFRRDPLRYDEGDNVTEIRLNLVVNISLWNRKENKLVWEENGFTGDATCQGETENAATITAALNDLARRIVERTVEQW